MKHLKLFIFLCILTFTVSCGQQKRFIQYKVEKGETISAIASKLNMKTEDLLRLNPDSTSEPVANSFIVVPEKKLNNYKNKIKENPEVIIDPLSNEDKMVDEKARLLEELKEKQRTLRRRGVVWPRDNKPLVGYPCPKTATVAPTKEYRICQM